MLNRLAFPLIALFWVTMNFLLWRAEFGPARQSGSPVSVGVVVRKILTAPDESSLEIRHRGQRIGYCHWVAGTAEEMTLDEVTTPDYMPEGMVRDPSGYIVHLEGNVMPDGLKERFRFTLHLQLSTNHVWEEFTLRLGNRPRVWEFHAVAADKTLEVRQGTEPALWSRRFAFSELQDPRGLVEELAGPLAVALVPPIEGLAWSTASEPALTWEARTHWLKLGSSRVTAYRLRLRLLDRYEAMIVVNRVGEIMQVDLPGDLKARNEVLVNF